jgi:hypothetical protein
MIWSAMSLKAKIRSLVKNEGYYLLHYVLLFKNNVPRSMSIFSLENSCQNRNFMII